MAQKWVSTQRRVEYRLEIPVLVIPRNAQILVVTITVVVAMVGQCAG